jgi:hypothetical protein
MWAGSRSSPGQAPRGRKALGESTLAGYSHEPKLRGLRPQLLALSLQVGTGRA